MPKAMLAEREPSSVPRVPQYVMFRFNIKRMMSCPMM